MSILVEHEKGFIHNPEQKVKAITNYFENIFAQKDISEVLIIKLEKLKEPITTQEIRNAIKKLKNNKSPGCDDVQAELIKYSPEIVQQHIANILKSC